MIDFFAALGLLLVIEGVVFAAAPGFAKNAMRQAAETSPERMRLVGIICAVAGVGLVWLARRVF
ncbi:MAG: DUF2065 domain-containing protein [Bosea sp. (in: a-proteobacteria)]